MNRDESIKVLKEIKMLRPRYFSSFSNDQKRKLIDDWTDELNEYDFESVISSVLKFMDTNNKVPYPSEISAILKKDEWKQYTRIEGNRIIYGESLIQYFGTSSWSSVIDFGHLDSKGLILEYDPKMNTHKQEHNRKMILERALFLKEKLFNENKN